MSISDLFEGGVHQQNKGHMRTLIKIALADGVIQEEEEVLLLKFAKRLNISKEDFQDIKENPDKYPISPPFDKESRYKRLYHLIEMVMADGVLEEHEISLAEKYAVGLGYPVNKVNSTIKKTIEFVQEGISFEDAFEKI